MSHPDMPAGVDEAQWRYSRWLAGGARVGLVVLLASFVAYVMGWVAPLVPLDELPRLWTQPVSTYLQVTGQPTGWGWLTLVHRADVMNLVGIALLASCSLPCLLAVLPCYARAGDRAFIALCLMEVVVLVAAASGLLGGGH